MSINSKSFIESLENTSVEIISIPKSDWHNHSTMGGNSKYLSKLINRDIILKEKYHNLNDIRLWAEKNLSDVLYSIDGYLKRIQASFVQAEYDNIKKLSLNFYINEVMMFRDVELFIKIIERYQKKYAPQTILYPELSIRWTDDTKALYDKVKVILSHKWFKSIDICGEELAQPAERFVDIYRMAESQKIILKAHVGEVNSAKDIQKTVDTLHLSQVHHGITAASSIEVMQYLRNNKVQLNICPTSNIKLGLVPSYSVHPIQILYNYGIKTTINSDDILCFNSSVSNEYIQLYDAKILSAKELDDIRLMGLNVN